MRYVNNYFYISSNSYFFQMNSNFNLIATSAAVSNCMYRQFYYDDSTSLFYVVQEFIYRVDVYNANCKLQSTISLNYNLYSINSFNGNLYVGGKLAINSSFAVNDKLFVGGDLSVNGNITGHFKDYSIPSTAIQNIRNQYGEFQIQTQRSDIQQHLV